jgi:integrase
MVNAATANGSVIPCAATRSWITADIDAHRREAGRLWCLGSGCHQSACRTVHSHVQQLKPESDRLPQRWFANVGPLTRCSSLWRIRHFDVTKMISPPLWMRHDLRHTYASLSRSAGADLKLLQVTMGHASIVVTAHTYADLYDSDLDRVADALDGLGG